VNAGAPWPVPKVAEAGVLGIQRKLHKWPSDDPNRRFSDLHNLVCDPSTLTVAWQRVRSNRGSRSAGVDGQTARHVEQQEGRALVAAQATREAHRPTGRDARPDQGRRRRGLARLHAQRRRPRDLPARPLTRGRPGADQAAPQPPGPQPPRTVRPPRQNHPQAPRRDPRRNPAGHQPRPHRGAQQQGPPAHPPRRC
jgi:hypothetical protein